MNGLVTNVSTKITPHSYVACGKHLIYLGRNKFSAWKVHHGRGRAARAVELQDHGHAGSKQDQQKG